jgi:NADH pyrophosphatase NudC (nudix superfamily)
VQDPIALAYLGASGVALDRALNLRHCARCGERLSSGVCTTCKFQHYSRVSPCAMVLVHDGADGLLLVQKRGSSYWSVSVTCAPCIYTIDVFWL